MSASVHGEKLLTTLPICLESDQLFVFNLSKLSWEFKPFVVAVNSTFFKSPAVSSGRVSSTLKHTSTATLLLLLLMGKNTFQHWAVWWPERAAKILPPSCFFPPGFYSTIAASAGAREVHNRGVLHAAPARGRIWHQFPPKLGVKSGRGGCIL